MTLRVLNAGSCEGLKGGVHGAAFGLVVLMGAYNAAAFIRRRQRHLAINAVIYAAAAIWEYHHVAHHCRALGTVRTDRTTEPPRPTTDSVRAA